VFISVNPAASTSKVRAFGINTQRYTEAEVERGAMPPSIIWRK
jgi:hypothetical protein